MRIAAAAPEIPWTDLANSLQPNGRTLDYVADAPYNLPIGIEKASFVAGLYALGQATGFYAPPGVDQDADLTGWYALINAGEPYDSNPLTTGIVDEIKTHHSSYYIDHSEPPAPLLISNGWTDDLFPPDEAIRFYNRTRTQYPGGADVSLFFLSYGHQRGQNKPADVAQLHAAQDAWFAHFLRGDGPAPFEGVTTLTQTCPDDAPSGGPYTAATWAAIAPGEVRLDSADAQTIQPIAGDPSIGLAFDPIAGDGACATASGDDQTGAATYRLPAAPAGGYTLMGSPTVVADLDSPGPHSQIAARLLDVAPSGEETLVARGLYRVVESSRQVFQLHPNGWMFGEGHVPKLELLPSDPPYSRPTNAQMPVTVSNLELHLPVLEQPGAAGGAVQAPAPKIVPPGYELAIDYRPAGPGAGGGPVEGAKKGCAGAGARRGSGGDDMLKGTRKADRLFGRGGDDHLAGKAGNDCLYGGRGDDLLIGGKGRDRISCGSGHDLVIAERRDRVGDGCERTRRPKR
jgi:hypothetical protein